MKRQLLSGVLLLGSVLCVAATVYLAAAYGQQVYFIVFHRPFHAPSLMARNVAYQAPVLPVFSVKSSLAAITVRSGGSQQVTVTAATNMTTTGFLEVWVTAPNHRQVYRSPVDTAAPHRFVAGKPETFTFDYFPAAGAAHGTYQVSDIITSATQQTDYYVNEEFGSFAVL